MGAVGVSRSHDGSGTRAGAQFHRHAGSRGSAAVDAGFPVV